MEAPDESGHLLHLAKAIISWQILKTKDLVWISAQVQLRSNFQREIVNIFLPILSSICFGCSKEPSH